MVPFSLFVSDNYNFGSESKFYVKSYSFLYFFKLLGHKNRGVQTIFVYEPSGSSQGQVPIFCINLAQFRLGLPFLSGSITGKKGTVLFNAKE
jgi:hypothetical protein